MKFVAKILSVFALSVLTLLSSASQAKSKPEAKGRGLFLKTHNETKTGHKILGYKEARRHLYNYIENENGQVKTHYSNIFLGKKSRHVYGERGDQNKDSFSNDFVNCEHTWPQGKFRRKLPMKSDLHHLFPTLAKTNNMRGSYPFGKVRNSNYNTSSGSKLGRNVFEPHSEIKGNVARALLYFFTRYYDRNIYKRSNDRREWAERIDMFISWHEQDPPDAWEMQRNSRIREVQGNSNPYIENPELVRKIGAQAFKSFVRRR